MNKKNNNRFFEACKIINKFINMGVDEWESFYTDDRVLNHCIVLFEEKLSDVKPKEKCIERAAHFTKVVVSKMLSDKIIVTEDTVNRLIGLDEKYALYLESKGLDRSKASEDDPILFKNMSELNELTSKLKIAIDEEKSKKNAEPVNKDEETSSNNHLPESTIDENQIKNLNGEIERLKAALEENRIKRVKLSNRCDSLTGENEALNCENSRLLREIEKFESKIKEITKTMNEQNDKVTTLSNELYKAKKAKKDLTDSNAELSTRVNTLEEKNKMLLSQFESTVLVERQKAISEYENELERKAESEKTLRENILSVLFENSYTLDELLVRLKQDSITISREDLMREIMEINKSVSVINDNSLSFPIKYGVCKKSVITNKSFDLGINRFILTSDRHISDYTNSLRATNEAIENYAKKSGIKVNVDLGDYVDFAYSPVYNFSICNKLLDLMEKISREDGDLFKLHLSGNHEKYLLCSGINPIEKLCSLNNKHIDLGFDHANIVTPKGIIGVHHGLDDDHFNLDALHPNVVEFLKKHRDLGSTTDFDFFGHFHREIINTEDGYGIVPSLGMGHPDIPKNEMYRKLWDVIIDDDNVLIQDLFIDSSNAVRKGALILSKKMNSNKGN